MSSSCLTGWWRLPKSRDCMHGLGSAIDTRDFGSRRVAEFHRATNCVTAVGAVSTVPSVSMAANAAPLRLLESPHFRTAFLGCTYGRQEQRGEERGAAAVLRVDQGRLETVSGKRRERLARCGARLRTRSVPGRKGLCILLQ